MAHSEDSQDRKTIPDLLRKAVRIPNIKYSVQLQSRRSVGNDSWVWTVSKSMKHELNMDGRQFTGNNNMKGLSMVMIHLDMNSAEVFGTIPEPWNTVLQKDIQ